MALEWCRQEAARAPAALMVLAETFHHSSTPFPPKFKEEWEGTSSTPPYGDRRRQGPRRPRTSRRARWWPGGQSSLDLKKSLAGRASTCLRSLAGRRRWCGTSWRILVSLHRWCTILDLPVPQMMEYVAGVSGAARHGRSRFRLPVRADS